MRHNLLRSLVNFKGEPFMRQVDPDLPGEVPLQLRDVLEQACLQANVQKYSTGDKKMEVYRLLRKVSAAEPFAQLSAEDVTLLKSLVGDAMSIVAVGAIFEMLENPQSELPAQHAET